MRLYEREAKEQINRVYDSASGHRGSYLDESRFDTLILEAVHELLEILLDELEY